MITQTLDLNLIPGRVLPMVNVSQYDKDSRTLEFTIYNGDQSFDLTGLSVYIQGLKPDGHGFNYSANISAGKITADITEQMTAVSGRVMCEVIIMDGTDRIGTGNFILNVEKAAMPDNADMSESDYSYIEELIEDAQAAQTAAEESAEDAEAWAVGKRNGTDVPATDPTYQNNAKYYADQAQIYAQGALKYKGSVLFANIPATGMTEGDMYNIEDDFTTDNRFQEGAGIEVAAGSNIAWNANSKWDVLTVVAPGVASFNGRTGAVTPASGDYDITDISATGGSEGQIPMVDSNGDLTLTNLPDTDTKSVKDTSIAELTSAGNALPLTIYGQSTQNGTPTPSSPVAIESASADFKCVGKNLLAYPYYETTKTVNGITFTDNGDGSVTVSGIASADAIFRPHMRQEGENNDFKLENGNYIFTGCPSGGSSSSYFIIVYRTDENNAYKEYGRDYGEGLSFTVNGDYFSTESANIGIDIGIKSGQDFTTPKTFYPMIRLASVTDSTYEPYKHTDITTSLTLRAIEVTSSDPYNLVKDGKYYIADTIDWDEVDGYTLTKRIQEFTVNGTEDWNYNQTAGQERFDITIDKLNIPRNKYNGKGMSDHFYCNITGNSGTWGSFRISNGSTQFVIVTNNDLVMASLADFLTWLGNNNTTFEYILETPTKTSLTSAQAKALLSMRTYDESTSIDAVNSPAPVLELEYAKTRTPALALTGHNMAHINAIDIGDM